MNRFHSIIIVISILITGAWVDRGDPGRSGTFTDEISPKFYDQPKATAKLLPIQGLDQASIDLNPAVANNTLVIASREGRIYALSTVDLTQKWSQDYKPLGVYATFTASPIIDNDFIYIPYYWISPDVSSSAKPKAGICCYNLEDGTLVWNTSDLKNVIESTPLIDGERIIFGCQDRKVHAILKNAKGAPDPDWNIVELSGQVKAGIAKLNDGRYIVACQGQPHSDNDIIKNLYCLNQKDGSVAWGPVQTKGSIDFTPATWDRYIYVTAYGFIKDSQTDSTGTLFCFDKDMNPGEMWSFPFTSRMTGSPATNGTYVVAADQGSILWVLKNDGNFYSKQAQYRTDGIIQCSPVIADHYVYAGTTTGYLVIYDLDKNIPVEGEESGEVQKLNIGTNEAFLKASPIIWNNSLFAVNNIGHVFRFDMRPDISVKFDQTDLTVKKGEDFAFSATVKNERKTKLPKTVKITLRSDAEWLQSTDTTAQIIDGNQAAKIIFSGTADKATTKPLTAKIIVSSDNPDVVINDITLSLTVTEKNIQVTYNGKPDEDFWDDDLERTMAIKNVGNVQVNFEVITDVAVKLTGLSSRYILLSPDKSATISFTIDAKTVGYDKQENLLFSFRSDDGIDFYKYSLPCTIRHSKKVIKLAIGKENATVDDTPILIQPAPFISKGVTMVPVRFISEGLGCQVTWFADIKTVMIDLKNENYLRLIIGSSKAYLDQPDGSIKEIPLTSPPMIVNGKTFVPLRLISEQFNCSVEWIAKTKEIIITKRLKP